MRVEAHIISIDDVKDIQRDVNLKEKDAFDLYLDYKAHLPKHEYYLYLSDTKTQKGATGWYELNARG